MSVVFAAVECVQLKKESNNHHEALLPFQPETDSSLELSIVERWIQRHVEEWITLSEIEAAFELVKRDSAEQLEEAKEAQESESQSEESDDSDQGEEAEKKQCSDGQGRLSELGGGRRVETSIAMALLFAAIVHFVVLLTQHVAESELWWPLGEDVSPLAAAPPLRPFFPNSSRPFINDYYTGNVHAVPGAPEPLLTVMLYYAPWSDASLAMRNPFETIARVFHRHQSQIRFSAVNCFAPRGQCRKKYKGPMFPVLVAYRGDVPIVYQGEPAADHLYVWIQRVLEPLVYIHTIEDLTRVALFHSNIVIGYYRFESLDRTPKGYSTYRDAAVKFATGKPEDNDTHFFVVSNRTIAAHLLLGSSSIAVHSLSGKATPLDTDLDSDAIVQAVKEVIEVSADSAIPFLRLENAFERKSVQLAELLESGALIVLATKHRPLYMPGNADIAVFKQVALEYSDCDGPNSSRLYTGQRKSKIDLLEQTARRRTFESDQQACRVQKLRTEAEACCRHSLSFMDYSQACTKCHSETHSFKWDFEGANLNTSGSNCTRRARRFFGECEFLSSERRECLRFAKIIAAEEMLKYCCEEFLMFESERRRRRSDIVIRLDHVHDEDVQRADLCMRHRLAISLNYGRMEDEAATPEQESGENDRRVTAYACIVKPHRALRFAILDTAHHEWLLSSWGLRQPDEQPREPVVVALDQKRQATYKMETAFSRANLREFIHDFHMGTLNSMRVDAPAHRFGASRQNTNASGKAIPHGTTGRRHLITRISTAQLIEIARTKKLAEDTCILFSGGPSDAASSQVVHLLQAVALVFERAASSSIRFLYVDTTAAEMPAIFDFQLLPTILFFSANRPSDSAVFPSDIPVSVPALVSFVLAHSSDRLFWRFIFSECDQDCVQANLPLLRSHERSLRRELRHWNGERREHSEERAAKQRTVAELAATRVLLQGLNERRAEEPMQKRKHSAPLGDTLSLLLSQRYSASAFTFS